jgi:hypothetical protein
MSHVFELFKQAGVKGGRHSYDLLIMGVPLDKLDKFNTYLWFERECRPEIGLRGLKIEIAQRLGYYRCNPWDSRAKDYYEKLPCLEHLTYLL